MSDADARDVIEKAVVDVLNEHTSNLVTNGRVRVVLMPTAGDAILAELADAGYAVVRKSQILVDAFGQPESISKLDDASAGQGRNPACSLISPLASSR